MISKASDKNPSEWDKQLPLLLFAYRSVVQESTKESPFFLLYGRDPRLPTGTILEQTRTTYLCDAEDYQTELFINLRRSSWHWRASNRLKRSSVRSMTDNRVAVLTIELAIE